jgi:hypothetical protein
MIAVTTYLNVLSFTQLARAGIELTIPSERIYIANRLSTKYMSDFLHRHLNFYQ